MMLRRFVLLSALLLPLAWGAVGEAQDKEKPKPKKAQPGDNHLALGNPSDAKHDVGNPDPHNFLMVKEQFALSYNSKQGVPNWVSYRLRKDDMGRSPRPQDAFHPDPDLPKGFYQVKPFDYHFNRTGMSRGHMCPNSHRSDNVEDGKATFVMTNMVPQTEELNDGAWKFLEIYCADLVRRDNKELFIVCGPLGSGGASVKGMFKTIGDGRVAVPSHCWKVVAVLDGGGTRGPLARFNKYTRIISVVMPNDTTPEKKPWDDYTVSITEVEKRTGLKFFDKVAPEVLIPLRKRVDKGTRIDAVEPRFLARTERHDERVVRMSPEHE